MSATPAPAYCPVCGEPRAAGTRFPSQYCGRGACRQAAHRAKGRLIEKFKSRPRKKPIEPPAETLAAMAMRGAWKSGEWFSSEWANTAARRCGIHLAAPALSRLLDELAEDLLDETVTGTGARSFTFPVRSSLAPRNTARDVAIVTPAVNSKRGKRAGAKSGVTVSSPGRSGSDAPTPRAPQAQGQGRQAAAPFTAVSVSMVSPLTIDGGTAFQLKAPVDRWSDQLRSLILLADRDGWKEMPDTWTFDDAEGRPRPAIVRRGNHGGVLLEFADEAQLELYDKAGFAVLIARAGALWAAGGLAGWMRTWLDLANWLIVRRRCPTPDHAHRLGWKTRNLELCADFTGLIFHDADLRRFVGARGRVSRVDSATSPDDDTVETFNLLVRGKNLLAISSHNKSQVLARKDKVLPRKSIYWPTWRAHGYDGTSIVRRVEVRAAGRALRLRTESGKVLDLLDPAHLLDEHMLATFWRDATDRRRLVLKPKRGDGLRGAGVDPRWLAVQAAGAGGTTERTVIDRSDVSLLDLATLRKRALRDFERAFARVVGLSSDPDVGRAATDFAVHAESAPAFMARVAAARASRDVRLSRHRRALVEQLVTSM